MSFRFKLDRCIMLAVVGAIVLSFISSIALASTVTLAWDKPETSDAIAGYHIYYGETQTDYQTETINDASVMQLEIQNLEAGKTYLFAASSHDGNGRESDLSEIISYEVPLISDYTIEAVISFGEGGLIRSSEWECRDNCSTTFVSGSSPEFDMIADTGYQISNVSIDGSSMGAISNYTFTNISQNHRITASFSRKEYTITATGSEGGIINPSGAVTALHGDSETFSISAREGYEIVGLAINGNVIDPANTYTFSNITADSSIRTICSVIDTGDDPDDSTDEGSEVLPDKPRLLEPAENAILSPGQEIRFESDVYSHPEGDAHTASRWQIRRIDKKDYFYDVITPESTFHEVYADQSFSGLKYAWRVGFQHLGSDQYSWSEERHLIIGKEVTDKTTPAIDPGETQEDFMMVAFTHWADDACSENIFSSLLESDYENGDYRIATYDPTLEGGGGYREYGNFEVVPGRSFWILARNGLDLTRNGVPVTTDADIFVSLDYSASNNNGWSMIAVPNDAVYSWGDIEVHIFDDEGKLVDGPKLIRQLSRDNPYIDTRIWEWKNEAGGKYESSDSIDFKMTPHTGYWVNTRSENVTLVFPHDMQVVTANSGSGPGALLADWWHAGINWIGEKLSPSSVFADLSLYDDIVPPMPMDALSDETPDDTSGTAPFKGNRGRSFWNDFR